MSKKHSTPKSTHAWLTEAEEVPRAKVTANKDLEKRQRFYRIVVTSAIVLLPLSLLTNVVEYGNAAHKSAVPVSAQKVNTDAKAAAILAVQSWLAQTPSPVAGVGKMLSWDGATPVAKPTQTAEQKQSNPLPPYSLEIDHFTIVDGQGVTYHADVQVAYDPARGTQVIGAPDLTPIAASDTSSWVSSTPWFGLSSATAPQAATAAVDAWAKAFTGGDSDALRIAVGDGDSSHSYVPLQNVVSESAHITYSAYLPVNGVGPTQANPHTSRLLAQVELSLQWAGQPQPQSGQKLPLVTYDVILDKADTAAPVVVAWGGAGTGPTLKPFSNALTGRTGTSASATAPTATPGPTDVPTGVASTSTTTGN